jgi:MFS family permease
VVIGAADNLIVMLAALFIVGAATGAGVVIWGTLLQRLVPLDMIGRVASLDFFVSIAFMPVSIAIAGPLSLLVPIPVIFMIAGIIPPATCADRVAGGTHARKRDGTPTGRTLRCDCPGQDPMLGFEPLAHEQGVRSPITDLTRTEHRPMPVVVLSTSALGLQQVKFGQRRHHIGMLSCSARMSMCG